MSSRLKIKSSRGESSSKVEIEGKQYIVQTEDMGKKAGKIVTRTYSDGAIIHTLSTRYDTIGDSPDPDKIREVMEEQHKAAIETLKKEKSKPVKSKAKFAEEIHRTIKKGDPAAALAAAKEALRLYASDLFFLSYYGYLIAAVERKLKEGQAICEESIEALKESTSTDKSFFYPLFYLNLGKALTAARRKRDAIYAFHEGLKYDPHNKELLNAVRQFGERKPPVLSFLGRSHPINKSLGKIRHRLKSK